MAPAPFRVRRLDDYVAKLEKAKVVLDAERRKEMILADAKNLAFAQGYELVEDAGLLAEVAGLVEWPVVLMGSFDEAFLAIPPEVIRTTIRNNQKCFVLRDPQHRAARQQVHPGVERRGRGRRRADRRRQRARDPRAALRCEILLRDRPQDAARRPAAEVRADRVPREARHAGRAHCAHRGAGRELAPIVGADIEKTKRAARLCKADLLTEVVGEFPELQGLMGKYYAEAQGEDEAVAHACEDHYRPKGPDDLVPADPVSVAVALADKIDTLVGFWAIDEKPTGSKDPYALRRAALGVLRLILENQARIQLTKIFMISHGFISARLYEKETTDHRAAFESVRRLMLPDQVNRILEAYSKGHEEGAKEFYFSKAGNDILDLMSFIGDRLRVHLREQGARHDLLDAVFALNDLRNDDGTINSSAFQDDLVLIVRRVEALGKFLDTDDGRNLLAGYKRATNILRIEEKKDAREYVGAPDPQFYRQDEERALARAIDAAKAEASAAVAKEDFEAAMRAMATLRPHVDAFFDKVTVNVADGPEKNELRANRLKLLNEIREATRAVADFSRIEGG